MLGTKKTIETIAQDMIKRRVIFITGSGLSNAAAGFPIGSKMSKSLIKRFVTSDYDKKKFNTRVKQLVSKYNLIPNDFKTILFSLYYLFKSRITHTVAENLDICRVSKLDITMHRLIAGFLEKGYIQAIINFNFDEILETVLDKKIKTIIDDTSAKDFLSDNCNCGVHLKPHGSVSDLRTLRFARKDFYRLEPYVSKLLFKLISKDEVTIVLVGFRIKKLDITKKICEALRPGSSLYVIDKKQNVVGKDLSEFYRGFAKVDKKKSLRSIFQDLKSEIDKLKLKGRI